MKPIEIRGGGLAGLSLGAALAQRGVPVRLWERHRIQRHRVCGEFICGVAPAVLSSLSIDHCFSGSLSLRRVHWIEAGSPLLKVNLPEPATGISRWALDQRIAETIRRAGGSVYEGSNARPAGDPTGVVVASGRQSRRNGWMGLKLHFQKLKLDGDLEVHLGRGAYVGCSLIEEGKVNVCGLFRPQKGVPTRGPEALFSHLNAVGLEPLATRLAGAEPLPGTTASVAGVHFGIHRPEEGTMVLGDAWAVIPPFTGNGMSMAFESALLALQPCMDYARGACSWREASARVAQAHHRTFQRRMRISRLIHPFILKPQARSLLRLLSKANLLPFCFLYRLTHH